MEALQRMMQELVVQNDKLKAELALLRRAAPEGPVEGEAGMLRAEVEAAEKDVEEAEREERGLLRDLATLKIRLVGLVEKRDVARSKIKVAKGKSLRRANCQELERKLPRELWAKITSQLEKHELFPLAASCFYFREVVREDGKVLRTVVPLLDLPCYDKYLKCYKKRSLSPEYIKWLFEMYTASGRKDDYPQFLNIAADNGCVDVFHWLVSQGCQIDRTNIMNHAAKGGSMELVRFLLYTEGPDLLSAEAARCSAKEGHLDILKFLRAQNPPCPWNGENCSQAAAAGGHLEVLKWMRDQDPPCPWNERTCASAAEGGHLEVLKWLRGQDPPCPWDKWTCSYAAGGHLKVLKWVRDQDPPCPWDGGTCVSAAREGRLDILKWLRDQDPPCPWSEETCAAAAVRGHFEVLRWLRDQDPPCPWDEETCASAAEGGHLDLLKWVRSQNPPCPWDEATCSYAAGEGHLEVLKWVRDQDPPCPWDEGTCASAAMYDDLHLLKWLRAEDPPCPWDEESTENAVMTDNMTIFKYLIHEGCPMDLEALIDAAEEAEAYEIMDFLMDLQEDMEYMM